MKQEQIIWFEPFINQLALIALDHDFDVWTDEGFENTVNVFIEMSKLN